MSTGPPEILCRQIGFADFQLGFDFVASFVQGANLAGTLLGRAVEMDFQLSVGGVYEDNCYFLVAAGWVVLRTVMRPARAYFYPFFFHLSGDNELPAVPAGPPDELCWQVGSADFQLGFDFVASFVQGANLAGTLLGRAVEMDFQLSVGGVYEDNCYFLVAAGWVVLRTVMRPARAYFYPFFFHLSGDNELPAVPAGPPDELCWQVGSADFQLGFDFVASFVQGANLAGTLLGRAVEMDLQLPVGGVYEGNSYFLIAAGWVVSRAVMYMNFLVAAGCNGQADDCNQHYGGGVAFHGNSPYRGIMEKPVRLLHSCYPAGKKNQPAVAIVGPNHTIYEVPWHYGAAYHCQAGLVCA
ncbi:MAG: hypothetical protein K8S55_11880 [Phycisphaerae bacterium]|nr:hypothetical protein [Phycisphaerae bacterium]